MCFFFKQKTAYVWRISDWSSDVCSSDLDRTGVVILQRGDLKVTASFALCKNSHVNRGWWVNPERLVFSISEKFGMLAKPQPTGELYAFNADGSDGEVLVGRRVAGFSTGTRLTSQRNERIAAFLVARS